MSCGGACGGRAGGSGTRRTLAALACAAALGVLAPSGLAQTGGSGGASDADLGRLIGMLDSPQYAVRQEATSALKIDERFTLPRLEAALRDPALSPEQRQRLLDVHLARFERTPRAAMGVQFDFVLPQRVVIDRLHEPFPVAKVLEPGDMIVSAGGVRLHGLDAAATMRSVILSHDPGDEVEIEVRRGAEKIATKVRLGGWSDFREGPARGSPNDADVRAAWNVRIARAAAPADTGERAIEVGLSAEQWNEMENAARMRRGNHQAALVRSGIGGVTPRLLLAGGQPRNDMPDEIDRERLELEGKNELNVMQWRRAQQMAEVRPRGAPESADQEITRLRQHSERLRKDADELRKRQIRGELDERFVAEFERELVVIEKLIEAVRADAASR